MEHISSRDQQAVEIHQKRDELDQRIKIIKERIRKNPSNSTGLTWLLDELQRDRDQIEALVQKISSSNS